MKKNIETIIEMQNYEKLKPNTRMYSEYQNYKKSDCQITLNGMMNIIKTSKQKDILFEVYNNIYEEELYKSPIHGINHNERVMLLGFFVGSMKKLSDEEMKILLYGCMYHDIGREDDFEDRSHGYRGSKKIENLIQDLDNYQKTMLEIMITLHSIDDYNLEKLSKYYRIKEKDKKKLERLCMILKDVDALDRVRTQNNDLDTSFLRYQISKCLLLASCELNYNYELLNEKAKVRGLK